MAPTQGAVNLPAGAATAAAAAATTTATTTAAAATTETTTTATATTSRLGASFVDVHGASVEFRSVQLRNGGFRFPPVRHFDEGEAAGLARVTIGYDVDAFHGTVLSKSRLQLFLSSPEIQISHEYIGHQTPLP